MTWLGRPLSWAYGSAIKLRNSLFDYGVITSTGFDIPVVSVGNITAGGTGKTPLIQFLIRATQSKGLKPGVVSRGYGGEYSDVQEVASSTPNATKLYGDEPVLTKTLNPDVPFYVGRERSRAVQKMLNENDVNLVLADDAFQHRALSRDLDVVLLDATQDEAQYRLLPVGRLREPLSHLARADYIVVTKWNMADEQRQKFITSMISQYADPGLKAVIYCDYEISNWSELEPIGEVAVFSGIGNPQAFERMLSDRLKIHSHKVFKDHYAYSKKDIESLLSESHTLVTTEKDLVKVTALGIRSDRIKAAKLSLSFDKNMEKLIGAIDQLCH